MIYFDSSALIKRYLREAGTEAVNSIIGIEKIISSSKLTYPETLSAFMRKLRTGEIEKKPFQTAVEQFENDWKYLLVVEFHDELLPIIKGLMVEYPLKGADSVHLSSAIWLERTAREKVTFVASDDNLLKAARAERLKTINPLD